MKRSKNNLQKQSISGSTPHFWPQVAGLVLLALGYWVAVRIGLLVVAQPEGVASIWPASGLALAILLLSPKLQWPKLLAVIFVTNAVGNLSGGNSFLVSLGFALANTLEALLGAWVLVHLYRSRITFGSIAEIFALFGVAILSNGITALLGAAVSALAFGAPFINTWLVWWVSDGLGMILVTPLIVTWATSQNMFQSAPPRRLVEAVLLVLVLVSFGWLLFGPFTVAENPLLRNYMLFPILIWLAFRFSPRGMASAIFLFAAIAIWYTLQGYGIFAFADETVTRHLVSVQIFLSVTSFSGLLLSAMVTARKRAEQNLRESEERYRQLMETLPDGVIVHSQGRIVFANPASAKISGAANPAELIGKPVIEFVHSDYREQALKRIQQSFNEGLPAPAIEEKFIRLDGTPFDVQVTAIPFSYAGTLAMLTVFNDITERKLAEEALRESEEKYRRLFDNAALGIFRSTPEGKAISVNPAFARMFGYDSPEDALKNIKNVGTDLFADPNRREEIIRLKVENSGLTTFENLYRRKDGKTFFGNLTLQQVADTEGRVLFFEGFIEDITTRKQAEDEIRHLNADLEQRVEARTRELRDAQEQLVRQEKLAVLGQLAGGVGHELRNPLSIINNAIYYLKLVQPDADEKIKQYHAMIEQEVHTSEKIITDLLDFSRIKSVDREPVSVPDLVQRVLTRFPVPSSVELALKLPASLPMALTDPSQMEQVLGNLVVNACQAMPEGGKLTISARVVVPVPARGVVVPVPARGVVVPVPANQSRFQNGARDREKRMVAIAVKDTGVGILPENMAKLFEPLFTTKPKGIGLGLAVSKKLAEANDGRIEVQSESGIGSTFTLFLPEFAGGHAAQQSVPIADKR